MTLVIVCMHAICLTTLPGANASYHLSNGRIEYKIVNRSAFTMLNTKFIIDTRLASRLKLNDASIAVVHEPMFWPKLKNMTSLIITNPLLARDWMIPNDADEDWTIVVSTKPIRIPTSGFCILERILKKNGDCPKGASPEDIVSIPMKTKPRPIMISPIALSESFLTNMIRHTPTKAKKGATSPTSRAIRWPVIVVPILLPKMT